MFSHNIKKLREICNIDQREFGSLFGVGLQTVHKWESGKSIPKSKQVNAIANYFNIPYNVLLDEPIEDFVDLRIPDKLLFSHEMDILEIDKIHVPFRKVDSLLIPFELAVHLELENLNAISIPYGINYQNQRIFSFFLLIQKSYRLSDLVLLWEGKNEFSIKRFMEVDSEKGSKVIGKIVYENSMRYPSINALRNCFDL